MLTFLVGAAVNVVSGVVHIAAAVVGILVGIIL